MLCGIEMEICGLVSTFCGERIHSANITHAPAALLLNTTLQHFILTIMSAETLRALTTFILSFLVGFPLNTVRVWLHAG